MPETLDLDNEAGVLTITLQRPDALNAFTVTMAEELIEAFTQASVDDEVRAVIVTGAGRAFCAGMDLSSDGNVFGLDESMDPTLADLTERFSDPDVVSGVRDTGGRVSLAIYACNKPVIAAINGPAVGIGATMTLPMDIRLASTRRGSDSSSAGWASSRRPARRGSCRVSWASTALSSGSTRPTSSMLRRPWRGDWFGPSTSRRTCCRWPANSRIASRTDDPR